MERKHFHFIGICGVAMSALAIALHNQGHRVTGSDAGFFPPVSTSLEEHGISFYPGWHPEKMIADGAPDIVIIGTASGTQNPETAYIKEHNIPFHSLAEAIGTFLIKTNSIVCAGTWGKTTTSALLSHIFDVAQRSPSYFTGGVAIGRPSGAITSSEWSIVEGDEYKSAPWDPRPKFFYYHPTHLLLTGVQWDHADLYPTEEAYFDAFRTLIRTVPPNGTIVACIDKETLPHLLKKINVSFVSYGAHPDAAYRYADIEQTKDGLRFTITHNNQPFTVQSPLLGIYNVENITGCFAMAHVCGIEPAVILEGIATFRGMKRRLEKRYEGAVTIIDDIAHSAEKVKATLANIRSIYQGKIIAIYEPNTGNRTPQSKPGYAHAFTNADEVIIPRLTKIKIDPTNKERTFDGDELARVIKDTHPNTQYIDNDNTLVTHITDTVSPGDVIVFLGSHGFRGMIEETIHRMAKT